MKNHRIHFICLTGGPCGGKTNFVARCFRELPARGIKVLMVPEAATHLISNMNISPATVGMKNFQEMIVRTQLLFEKVAREAAEQETGDVVVLCDRGLMDNLVYLSEETETGDITKEAKETYSKILRKVTRWKEPLKDGLFRYEAVIHIVSAADGAERFYNLDNEARSETVEQARKMDRSFAFAYWTHPNLYILDNSTNFEEKMKRGMQMVYDVLGIPAPIEREHKFLLNKVMPWEIQFPHVDFKITQTYLRSSNPDIERRVRRRESDDGTIFFYTEKRTITMFERIENERIIDEKEYMTLLMEKDPEKKEIRKTRTCFLFSHQRFELDNFAEDDQYSMLEIEMLDNEQQVVFPDSIQQKLVREVTEEADFRNSSIAERGGRLV